MISAREKFLGIVHFEDGEVMLLFPVALLFRRHLR